MPANAKNQTESHTPGPWRIDVQDGKTSILGPVAHGPGVVGWSYAATVHGLTGEKQANARLIASAPELLEACQEALACILKHVPATTLAPRDMLRAAITRATRVAP